MKKILAIILLMCCALPVMAKKRQNEEIITPLTQLEKRQFQTKTYSAQDNIVAMKSILNVLQDEGFIVYNVNSILGYIYGVKDFDLSDSNVDISKEFGLTKSRLNYNGVKVATLEVSVNVTQYGEQTRIRANFKRKLFNEYGNAQMIEDINETEYYDDFYKKVDTAIVLQKKIAQKNQKAETPVSEKKTLKPRPPVKRPVLAPEPVVIKPQSQEVSSREIPQEITPEQQVKELQTVEKNEDVKPDTPVQPVQRKEVSDTIQEVKCKEPVPPPQTVKIPQIQTEQIKKESKPEVKEEVKQTDTVNQKESASEHKSEQNLDFVPVDTEPEYAPTSKEEAKALKELVKQAKLEAKQAQKEAQQAQKEAMQLQKDLEKEALEAQKEALKSEKEAQKEAKRREKEMRE